MAPQTDWHATEHLAWTGHDGPGRPPAGAIRPLWLGLAAILSVVFAGLVLSDSLCPEHRAWVQALGAVALLGTATSVVALLRGWAGAPAITLVSAGAGVVIGVIDAAHDTTRGATIAVAFAVTIVGAALLYARQLLLARWDRRHLAPSDTAAPRLVDQPATGRVGTGPGDVAPATADPMTVAPADIADAAGADREDAGVATGA